MRRYCRGLNDVMTFEVVPRNSSALRRFCSEKTFNFENKLTDT